MSDINQVIQIGRMVSNPELKYTKEGTAVSGFSIAVNKVYFSNDQKQEKTYFFNCVAWAKMAETIVKYVKKGHRIGIQGELQQDTWEDQEGKKRSAVKILVKSFQFLQPKNSNDTSPPGPDENPFSDSDIPF